MNIYDNETTTKTYTDLNPTAPQEPQMYRLKELTEIEAYLLDEIEVREQIAKKMKRFNTITGIVGTGLITSTVVTGENSIAAFASSVGLSVGIALSGTILLLSSNMWNQLQNPTPHLFSCLSLSHHPSRYCFEAHPNRVSLTYHPSTFDHTLFH